MATAWVTGASAGLGEGFARRLAARGDDLILTARRADRLEALAAELRAGGRQVTVLPADLAAPGAVDALMAAIAERGLSVNLLINNAGFGARGAFAALDRKMQLEMIDLNCRVLAELCHAVLPGMIQMRGGGILNIASTAAFQPGPWMTVYYATKAFVLSFSEGLHDEVKAQGVRVAALCPGATRTEFGAVADVEGTRLFRLFAGDAAKVVEDGLRALDRNQAVKVSGIANAAMAQGARFSPRWMARAIAGALQRPE